MKTIVTEAKNILNCIKFWLDITEEKVSESKEKAIEAIQNGTEKKRLKKVNISDLHW